MIIYHIMNLFRSTDLKEIAEVLEDVLTRVGSQAQQKIVQLPGEPPSSQGPFWNSFSRLNDFHFFHMSSQYAHHARKIVSGEIDRVPRHETGEALENYIDGILTKGGRFYDDGYQQNAQVKWSDLRDFFFVFSSKEQFEKFNTAQTQLVESLSQKILKNWHDYSTSTIHHAGVDFGINSRERLIEFIQNNADYFGQNPDLQGIIDFIPELGFDIGGNPRSISAIISHLAALPCDKDMFKSTLRLSKSYGLEEENLLRFVRHYPDRFGGWKGVDIIASIPHYIGQALEQDWIVRRTDVAAFVNRKLYDDHKMDILPASTSRIINGVLSDEEGRELDDLLAVKKGGDRSAFKRVSAEPISPYQVKVANDIAGGVAEIFAAEAVRPARGDLREAGGRARLGPQMPNLWNPVEP